MTHLGVYRQSLSIILANSIDFINNLNQWADPERRRAAEGFCPQRSWLIEHMHTSLMFELNVVNKY